MPRLYSGGNNPKTLDDAWLKEALVLRKFENIKNNRLFYQRNSKKALVGLDYLKRNIICIKVRHCTNEIVRVSRGFAFLMMMKMMNCFYGMVDRRKAFSLIYSQDHCQKSCSSWISDTSRAGFEPAQNLSQDFVEWRCALVIITTPRRHVGLHQGHLVWIYWKGEGGRRVYSIPDP